MSMMQFKKYDARGGVVQKDLVIDKGIHHTYGTIYAAPHPLGSLRIRVC
jgi:hypothetical protein